MHAPFICTNHGNDLQVMTADKVNEVGKITKKWAGVGNEFLTDAETYHLT